MFYINVKLVDYDVYEEISLVFEKTDIPKITDPKRQVLIKVRATGINRSEIHKKREFAAILEENTDQEDPPTAPLPILGNEAVGYIVNPLTYEISSLELVGGVLDTGGYGQYVIMDESNLIKFPQNLTLPEAASIPNSWLSAFHLLHLDAKPKPKSYIYISAGASGIGVALIQLLKKKYKTQVIASTSTQTKALALQGLGADLVINYKESGLTPSEIVARVLGFTGGKGVDMV